MGKVSIVGVVKHLFVYFRIFAELFVPLRVERDTDILWSVCASLITLEIDFKSICSEQLIYMFEPLYEPRHSNLRGGKTIENEFDKN